MITILKVNEIINYFSSVYELKAIWQSKPIKVVVSGNLHLKQDHYLKGVSFKMKGNKAREIIKASIFLK